jgi:hypothetical protein
MKSAQGGFLETPPFQLTTSISFSTNPPCSDQLIIITAAR